MAAETMKEYLVKIGWDIDEDGFKKSMSLVNSIAGKLSDKAAGIASSFIKAGGIISTVLTTINESLVSVVEETAKLDQETEELARKYWTTEQNARSFDTALKVLGRTEEDLLYMTQEQYQRFIELNRLGRTLEAPKELDNYLVKVRGLNFELSRLKMIFQYGTRWLTYWISQFTGEDVETFTKRLRALGDYIIKNMQPITKAVAKFFEMFYKLGKAGVKLLISLGKVILWVVNLFDSQISRTIFLVTILSKALLASPLTMFIGLLLTLLLLIDDYMTWKRGGESALDWSNFDDSFSDLLTTFNDLKEAIQPVKEMLDDLWHNIFSDLTPVNLLQKALEGVADVLDGIAAAIDVVNTFINDLKNFGDVLSGKKSFRDYLKNDQGALWGAIGNLFTHNENDPIFGSEGFFGRLFSKSGFFSSGIFSGFGSSSNTTNNQTNTINIHGTDAKSIGDEVANRLTVNFPTRSPY